MERDDLNAYFARIGYRGEAAPTLATLREIVLCHTRSIPFENLDPLLGRPVLLDLPSLLQKLVHDRRGGYCFEQNTLLLSVLEALGYRVSGLAARVRWNVPEQAITSRGHMLLRVELDERTHLVDVGFGGLTLTGVLRLASEVEQPTPHEPFRLLPREDWLELQALVQGAFRPIYRFTLERQFAPDYEVSNYFLSTHPASHFRKNLMAARPTEDGRYALANDVLTVHHRDGRPSERHKLTSARALQGVLENEFGLRLPATPELVPLLERLLEGPR